MRRKPPATFVRSTPVLHERVQKKIGSATCLGGASAPLSFCGISSPSSAETSLQRHALGTGALMGRIASMTSMPTAWLRFGIER